jgi:hypothetical protein
MRVTLIVVASVAAIACTAPKDPPPDLLARLESAPPGERDRLVREAIEGNGGTPLVEGDSALFFVEGSSGPPPRLLADFNGWYLFPADRRTS